jgi:hypothetical protein
MKVETFNRNATNDDANDPLTTRALGATFRPSSVNVDARTVEVVFASDISYTRNDWYTGMAYDEVLSMDPAHVRLERMQSGAPLCDNHNRFGRTLDCVFGVVEEVRLEGSQMVGVIRFSKRATAEEIFQDVIDGILRNFSIGYRVYAYDREAATETKIETRTAVSWEPFELSITPVPADYTAQVRTQNKNLLNPQNKPTVMDEDILTPGATPTVAPTAPVATETRTGAPAPAATPALVPAIVNPPVVATDIVTRTAAQVDVANPVSVMQLVRMAGLPVTVAEDLVGRNLSASAVTAEVTRLYEAAGSANVTDRPAAVTGGDEAVRSAADMTNAILHRSGAAGVELTDGGRRFRSLNMLRMAGQFLEGRGIRTSEMGNREIAKRAMQYRFGGAHTSSDFPTILGSAINISLRKAYELQPRTFMPFSRRELHADLREHSKAQLSGLVGNFGKVKEGGEYKSATFTEAVESYKVEKYGEEVPYTLEMIIQDRLDAFSRIPTALAAKAAQLQSDLVYGVLSANANMADGNALFSAAHGNNAASGGAITEASLNAARTAMMLQKDLNGDFIGVSPRFIVVGPTRMLEAQKMLTGITANTTGAVNVFAGSLTLIVEPRLGSAWYLMADPSSVDTINYAFLDGEGELFTETYQDPSTDSTKVKARMFFGTKAIDHRGMYRNAGA